MVLLSCLILAFHVAVGLLVICSLRVHIRRLIPRLAVAILPVAAVALASVVGLVLASAVELVILVVCRLVVALGLMLRLLLALVVLRRRCNEEKVRPTWFLP